MKKVAECLYLNESSKTYYALVKRSGKQIRRSLKTQDRKLAERRLKEFREKVGNLSSKPEDRKLKFEPFAKRWIKIVNASLKPTSAESNRRIAMKFVAVFGNVPVSEISKQDCEDWVASRSKQVSARTSNYDLQVLKRIFAYAEESGVILSNPASGLKPRKERKKAILVPTRSQFDSLVATLEEMAARDSRICNAIDLVRLLAYSGMRKGEAIRIVFGEIDFERDRFTVSGGDVGTKNGEERVVPLFPRLRTFLEDLLGGASVEDPNSRIMKIDSAKKAIATAVRIAGLPHFDHHCLRHYFVSNAIENGIDFKTIATWVGHKDGGLLVAKTYGHLRDTHSFEMAKLMK